MPLRLAGGHTIPQSAWSPLGPVPYRGRAFGAQTARTAHAFKNSEPVRG